MNTAMPTALLIVSAVSCFILAVVVFVRNPHKPTHRTFTLLATVLGFWALGVAAIINSHAESVARSWVLVTFIVSSPMPLAFHLFVGYFPRERYQGFRPLLWVLLLATPVMIIGAFTPWYVTDVAVQPDGPPEVTYGPILYVFAACILLTMLLSYPTLIRKLLASSGLERLQIQHVLLGIFLTTTLAYLTNVVAPALHIVGLEPYGPMFTVLMMAIFAYAMVRYHLLDIRVIVSRTTVYAVVTGFVMLTFFSTISLVHLTLSASGHASRILSTGLAALIIAVVIEPLKERVQLVVDRAIVKRRYDTNRLVARISRNAGQIVQLDELLRTVVEDLRLTIGIGKARVVLLDDQDPAAFVIEYSSDTKEIGTPLRGHTPLIRHLERNPDPLVLEKLVRSRPTPESISVAEHLAELDTYLCLPLETTSGLVGALLLGRKTSRQIYSSEDLMVLTAIATPVAAAIENARLYRQIEEVNAHFSEILSKMRGGVIAVDTKGDVRTVNQSAARILGPVEIGRNLAWLTPELAQLLEQTLRERRAITDFETVVKTPDGESVPVVMSSSCLFTRDNVTTGAMAMIYDLSQVKRLEQNVQRAGHLSSIGTLAAGMAHEIKNPLVSIKTFTQLLMSRYDDPDFRGTFASVVPHEVERIDAIVSQLLDFSRPKPVEFAPRNVRGILDHVLGLVKNQTHKAKIQVHVDFPEESIQVHGDDQQLHQLFLNLVLNAIDALTQTDGGSLTLRAELGRMHLRRQNGRQTLLEAECVRVTVADTGPGIPEDSIDQLFTPFYTTKAEGSGLGLAVVHGIVTEHSGEIDVKSRVGEGTSFVVTLPLAITAVPTGV